MKVLLVSDAGNIHTKRWATALSEAGIDVVLFSITPMPDDFYQQHGIELHVHDLFSYKKGSPADVLTAVPAHFKAVKQLQHLIKKTKPDILHAHYATSYGLIAALTDFKPLVISVWGSDIYEFPCQSKLNRLSVEFTLAKADRILSTSVAMARQTLKYCPDAEIGITPFGVDTEKFKPAPAASEDHGFVFCTVKTLGPKYGIDLLLKAFAEASRTSAMRLLIAGDGADREKLENLAEELGISDRTEFLGHISHDAVPGIYARANAAIFLSRVESFGVSAVEAMACGCPVIASDTPGFSEILENGAGILVPRGDIAAAAEAMRKIASETPLRQSLSTAGRARVLEKYRWSENVATMIEEYRTVLKK